MLEESIAQAVLQKGLELGADFSEIYIEESRNSSVLFKDTRVESAQSGIDFGIGIRLIKNNQVYYGHSSRDELDHLLELTQSIGRALQDHTVSQPKTEIASLHSLAVIDAHPVRLWPQDAIAADKLALLRQADEAARSFSPRIRQLSASLMDSTKQIQIYNSEGLEATDKRCRTRFMVNVIAEHEGLRFTAHETPGALKGFEFLDELDIEALTIQAAERALLMLEADYIDGGLMPVVMGNGFGGVIFHEACGHPLETESIRKKSSPFCDKLGQAIASPVVSAVDDGTLPNEWGSINIDDEGMPTRRTQLIENGILKNFISDRVGAGQLGLNRTGSARRQSYEYAPVSRMRNTWIEPGQSNADDMISSIDNGIFAKKMGGGSVNPATGEFNFAVEEAYLIQKGQITKPVRSVSLIGKGHEILHQISMVGDDLKLAAGMCGASSGMVPVTVGQPSLKVDQILVGGR